MTAEQHGELAGVQELIAQHHLVAGGQAHIAIGRIRLAPTTGVFSSDPIHMPGDF